MEEFVCCSICGFKGKILTKHIIREHGITTKEYRDKYGSAIESEAVRGKRKSPNIEKYGVSH